ncbi:MAG: GIY-YIG nuclease family protein [Candidatus Pacebacteria bacterium]|nr:GIY-YIG nuclease family protein [Candidatus Paceibacterota bacterium]
MPKKDKEKSKLKVRARLESRAGLKTYEGLKARAGVRKKLLIEVYFTYILKCADETLYVGATNNLEKRLVQHNTSKQGAHYTKIRRPVSLVYHETFKTLSESRKREAEVKRLSRFEKLKLFNSSK